MLFRLNNEPTELVHLVVNGYHDFEKNVFEKHKSISYYHHIFAFLSVFCLVSLLIGHIPPY